jgi:uncharacterized repeat protein (TIGR01451 family)
MHAFRSLPSLLLGAALVSALLMVFTYTSHIDASPLLEWEGNMYWKDGGWPDYGPGGVPDFDQKQDLWDNQPGSGSWSYCGPVAVANSLWWFDSKFEPKPMGPLPGGPPSTIPPNDYYYLVTAYGQFDDHDPQNVGGMGVMGLVDDLAWHFDTDGIRTGISVKGTNVHSMSHGLQWYLYNDPGSPHYRPGGGNYYDDYHVQLVKMPTWEWVVEEVQRSEDVVLLLGFWAFNDPPQGEGSWERVGGHFVTVAGINATDLRIAFSDPFHDNAEAGGPGRVFSGSLSLHSPTPHITGTIHNDAGNVSHDIYPVNLTPVSPAGLWEIEGYPYLPGTFSGQNIPAEFQSQTGGDPAGPIFVEVEYALAMSPFYWKPGGEWVDTWWNEQWITEWWSYEDDGDSCLPDFSWAGSEAAFMDGPVVVANSLWWFDSKAETLVTGGFPKPPPVIADHYPLVTSYDPLWDDHAITNTQLFINALTRAEYLNTSPAGTVRDDMAAGIDTYLADAGVAHDFYTKTQIAPSFEWVADEVETSEDVIMLLGFYENTGVEWERKGGHWVNAAGVNRTHGFIGLSDPEIDHAVTPSISETLYLGRVFPPERVGAPFTTDEKQNPQSISHDIYRVTASPVAAGQWALVDYPANTVAPTFIGLNGGGSEIQLPANVLTTVVEWAIGVSPHSDLVITKTAQVTEVIPGDRLTYTLEYANHGLAAAKHVTITDNLPTGELADIAYTAYPPIMATPGTTYTWSLDRLSYGQRGVITITAISLVSKVLTNTATITGLNNIDKPTPDRDPGNNVSGFDIPRLQVAKLVTPYLVAAGDILTYTIRVTNTGNVTLHATVTDSLPAQTRPSGLVNWQPVITANGGVWVQTITQTASLSYIGMLTNVVQVSTLEGAFGAVTTTSRIKATPGMTVTKFVTPYPIQAGVLFTYTIIVTNTGNVDLHTTITDYLPAAVTPSGSPTWSAVITAPGDIWWQTIVVSVPINYSQTLTNIVHAVSAEGVSVVFTHTGTPGCDQIIYLPVVIKE